MLFGLILKLRHRFYDKGWKKSSKSPVPTICVGNVALGGTGKTPMTELILRTLLEDHTDAEQNPEAKAAAPTFEISDKEKEVETDLGGLFEGVGLYDGKGFGGEDAVGRKYSRAVGSGVKKQNAIHSGKPLSVAVLSRGYKRKTKGFQLLPQDCSSILYGDEPVQIKRKFSQITVAVDADRVEGCRKLADSSLIILDDAFQHRSIVPDTAIVLTTYDRPYFRDNLVPWGKLRDLPSRVGKADMVVVTKCPPYVDEAERRAWAADMGLKEFDYLACCGKTSLGHSQYLLFAMTRYDTPQPLFEEGDRRYTYSKSAILVTGIANDIPLLQWLEKDYSISSHLRFADHHSFTRSDLNLMERVAMENPTSVIFTTEKDAQRLKDTVADGNILLSGVLKHKIFIVPIRMQFLSQYEQDLFKNFLNLQLNKNTESL